MKGSRIFSVVKAKCPVCHQGEVFDNKGAYDLRHMDKMHSHCSNCGHKYEKEQGFWYGAMYVSYGLTVGLSVAAFVLSYLIFPNVNVWWYIGIITFLVIVFAPLTFRLSRLIWMNMFAHYDPLKTSKSE